MGQLAGRSESFGLASLHLTQIVSFSVFFAKEELHRVRPFFELRKRSYLKIFSGNAVAVSEGFTLDLSSAVALKIRGDLPLAVVCSTAVVAGLA